MRTLIVGIVAVGVLICCGTVQGRAAPGRRHVNPYLLQVQRCHAEGMHAYHRLLHVMRRRPGDVQAILPAYLTYTLIRIRYAALTRLYQQHQAGRSVKPPVVAQPPARAVLHHGVIEGHNVMADVELKVSQQWSFSLPADEADGYRWNERLTDGNVVKVVGKGHAVEEGRHCTVYRLQAVRQGKAQFTLSQVPVFGGAERRVLNFAITVSDGRTGGSRFAGERPPEYGDILYRH